MNVNDKLLQYLDFKGLSQRQFTQSLSMAEGVLRRGKNIGSGYLARIRRNYPDLNLNWVLFDEGEMIIDANSVNEAGENYGLTPTLDELVDIKIDERFKNIELSLAQLVEREIKREIESMSPKTKNGSSKN